MVRGARVSDPSVADVSAIKFALVIGGSIFGIGLFAMRHQPWTNFRIGMVIVGAAILGVLFVTGSLIGF